MSEPETITLKESGLVLTLDTTFEDGTRQWEWLALCSLGCCELPPVSETPFFAWCGEEDTTGTRDECLAWLDSRAIALRSALLPPDARERVARALVQYDGGVPDGAPRDEQSDSTKAYALADADRILAALGIGGGR